ncbi:acetyl-CoA carboxylase biotin carboxyl carrier protein [Paenibacillus turicensis]|uniref:acetyl-CoA carboxylase biotin carboxyl carrier protein n=1 Tax=Paenibacillus turicensis TaxID=160487 RepID=UPI003D2B3295
MLKLSEIKELIELVDKSTLQELEIENEGSRLSIRKASPQFAPVMTQPMVMSPSAGLNMPEVTVSEVNTSGSAGETTVATPDTSHLHTIVSPMVGTFYRSSSPDANPFVNIGDKVGDKTTVCIIEAMKLMNELEAEVKGSIVDILVENGQLVEYGQPLFLVKPE